MQEPLCPRALNERLLPKEREVFAFVSSTVGEKSSPLLSLPFLPLVI